MSDHPFPDLIKTFDCFINLNVIMVIFRYYIQLKLQFGDDHLILKGGGDVTFSNKYLNRRKAKN